MIKKYTFLAFTLFSLNVSAQELKNAITFDIAPLIVQPSRLSFGYMRNINERVFVGGEFGYSFSEDLGRMNGKSADYKQLQYRFEVGYILSPTYKVHHFLSLDFQHINHKETLFNGHFKGDEIGTYENEVFYKYDKIKYERLKNTFSFNYGIMVYFGEAKKVGVIPKIGLGIKVVDVKFTEAINLQQDTDFEWGWFDFGNRYEREGDDVNATINLQVKFFYKF